MLEQAISYLKKSWGVIPVAKDKKPLEEWRDYQKRLPTEEEVNFWFDYHKDAQVGILTGRISGIAVIDVEFEGIGKTPQLPATFTVKTGGGGYHYYYKWQEGIGNRARVMPFLDVRGEGGYVVAPPSETTKGKYEVVEDLPLADFPMWILGTKKEYTAWEEIVDGVPKGQRNQTAATLAGKLMKALPPSEWRRVVWPFMEYWNNKCDPPMAEWELKTTFTSIANKATQNNWADEEEDKVIHAETRKAELEEQKKNKPKFIATTGLQSLDDCVEGFRKSQLIVLSAPPKAGKTSMCQTFTKRFTDAGIKCLWFSYELSYEELFGKFPMEKLDFYVPKYMKSGNLDWIERKIVEAKDKFGTEIVFIDHLDFLRDPKVLQGVSLNLASYVGGIVQKLKSIAREQDIIIFLMCHIRKNQWTSKDLPASEELRDSGQIAQLADIVLMMMRRRAKKVSDEIYDGNRAVLGVIENRHNGKTKKIPLVMVGKEFVEELDYKQEKVNEEVW